MYFTTIAEDLNDYFKQWVDSQLIRDIDSSTNLGVAWSDGAWAWNKTIEENIYRLNAHGSRGAKNPFDIYIKEGAIELNDFLSEFKIVK